jgi:hypothetical protein
MGLAGQYFAKSAIFFGAAALCIPALIALSRIRADEIDYARARNAGKGKQAKSYHRIFDLGKNRNLYIYGGGNSDILWRNDNGQVYVWEMNGLQVKAEGAPAHPAVPNDWHILA